MENALPHTATYTIAFYNVENLFSSHHPTTGEARSYLPFSERPWSQKRYFKKLTNLGFAISKIGVNQTNNLPSIIGLAEVENEQVVTDLLNTPALKNTPYNCIHFNSEDTRGMDVAFVYNQADFTVTKWESVPVKLPLVAQSKRNTRDILLVSGLLKGQPISILVNHWPSRRDGAPQTEPNRMAAAKSVCHIINRIKETHRHPFVIVMGDFNDDPHCKSMYALLEAHHLHNPFKLLYSYRQGSYYNQKRWHLFDQVLLSPAFLTGSESSLKFKEAGIFNAAFLKAEHGPHKKAPLPTYSGYKYMGGYSDHFPVFIKLNL
ncbi:endonuclease/exonuclease/phosphatase family protein [Bizionia sediminis]|uniref:Endonuclease/exonuclease/phosphatase family protein n=1 Tax=Bizionia sediminis TaxID=1737064 RepID=A0ABW5KS79_9FLAO